MGDVGHKVLAHLLSLALLGDVVNQDQHTPLIGTVIGSQAQVQGPVAYGALGGEVAVHRRRFR